MAKCLHYALIGFTGIGECHLNAIREMANRGAVRLVAVADPVLARQPDLRADLQTQGVCGYVDYREMLAQESALDTVVISAPIPYHLEMTLACLERGVFVYLEKPPVPLIQQLEKLVAADAAERVGVGFQMIQSRWVQALKTAVTAGQLGPVQEIRIGACWPRLDQYYRRNSAAGKMALDGEPIFDGPATNAMAHLIHNAMFLASPEPGTYAEPLEIAAELYRARPIESYDVACLRGKFSTGASFTAALTHATEAPFAYRLEVRGRDGWARISEDGAVFDSSFAAGGRVLESTQELVSGTHRQFLAFARGEQARPATSLRDTRGYVLATNGMLLASGGIHSIDAGYVQRYTQGQESGYDVAGLRQAVETCAETGRLFSELGLPWAIKTTPVPVDNLRTLTLPVS